MGQQFFKIWQPDKYFGCQKTSDWGTLVPRINVENGIKLGFLLE
jgi:hypothetical protein